MKIITKVNNKIYCCTQLKDIAYLGKRLGNDKYLKKYIDLVNNGIKLYSFVNIEDNSLIKDLINCDDMIVYWRKVRDFVNKSIYGKELYDWLSNPSFNIVLSSSIEDNTFVKKYGSWDIAYHEAGYVDAKEPYYIIILTQKFKCDDKEEFVNSTAKQLHRIHKFINNK